MTPEVKAPGDRLLLVGNTARDTQVFIGDKEITTITQRIAFELDARDQVAHVVLTLLPREGFSIALGADTAVAFVPVPGLRWRQLPAADGSVLFQCEREREPDTPAGYGI